MADDKDKIIIYSNGATYEADKSILYDPFPPKPKETDEKQTQTKK